jgi:excisionase family DNA binding protein
VIEQLLTLEETARLIGTYECSGIRFPRRLIAERRIRFVHVGKYVRIPASAVAEYIAGNTVEPVARPRRRAA